MGIEQKGKEGRLDPNTLYACMFKKMSLQKIIKDKNLFYHFLKAVTQRQTRKISFLG